MSALENAKSENARKGKVEKQIVQRVFFTWSPARVHDDGGKRVGKCLVDINRAAW